MKYNKALSIVRATKGLQQKDIAAILNVTPSYVSRIENGDRPMTEKMVNKLCSQLKIPENLFRLLGQDSDTLDVTDTKHIDEMSKRLLRLILQS